jgi:hypothetical protein
MSTDTTETTFYVLPPGATQEEQWTRTALEDMCRSGQFSPDSRIFLPDRNEWVRAAEAGADTGLDLDFGGFREDVWKDEDDTGDGENESLAAEYERLSASIRKDSTDAELHIEAGRVASEMKNREVAREHFQKALQLQPFNTRFAQEVQRRFSRSECADFHYLRRDPPPWDELTEMVAYPLSGGPVYFAVVAASLFVLLLIPFGYILAWPLVGLWCLQMARATARGNRELPLWHDALDKPVREIVLPLIAGLVVWGQCVLVAYALGRIFMGSSGGTALGFVAESPVLSVLLPFIALVYLPALFVRITHSAGIIVDLLFPWTAIRIMIRMGQEYAISTLAVVLAATLIGVLVFAVGGIPVLGKLVLALAITCLMPVVAFVLGRLAGRKHHRL